MKIETILNALVLTEKRMSTAYAFEDMETLIRRNRQYRAFRARILRLDAEKDAEILELLQLQTKEALIRDGGEYWFNRDQPKRELR